MSIEQLVRRTHMSIDQSRRMAALARERIESSSRRLAMRRHDFERIDQGIKDDEWQDRSERRLAEAEQSIIEREVQMTARAFTAAIPGPAD